MSQQRKTHSETFTARVARLMRVMGVQAVVPGTHTSCRQPAHRTYPYLLRELTAERPNHV